jgi:hypothetical protein
LVKISALLFLVLLLLSSCRERIADNPIANQVPSTHLWLDPDSAVGIGVSKQHIHWFGDDPDGLVRGYLIGYMKVNGTVSSAPQPDTMRYWWTTSNDTIIAFPLDTLFRRYLVVVRAVDQIFNGLPQGSAVRLSPFAFWDKNDNGSYDAGDVMLPTLEASMDPKGAALTFPIRNSPPSVTFLQNPNDPSVILKQPDTTFTVATFGWTASDPDGNGTLVSYRIALNDTTDPSSWLTLPLRDSVVTLVVPRFRSDAAGATVDADVYAGPFLGRQLIGSLANLKLDDLNKLYVEVKDVAGEFSQPITMPAGNDHWFVRRPRGKLLLVSDYLNSDQSLALSTYFTAIHAVPGFEDPQSIDRLNIDLGVTLGDKSSGRTGTLVPGYADPALIQTFLLFDYVVWYTDQQPSLGTAQLTIFPYIQNGGKVLFSTSFINTIDPRGALRDFAPIDSVSSVDLGPTRPAVPPPVAGDTRIPANFVVYADSSDPADIYPQLQFNSSPSNHIIFMRPIYRRADARYLYHLQADTRNRYIGEPNIAVIDGQKTIIFVGLPLHLLNNVTQGSGLVAFFTKALYEFKPTQLINRSVF